MSKNQEERANYYLNIDGQAVPVSEQIYRVYQHYERKEEYFSYDLKTEKFQKETASFLPSREDSYERLLEKDRQFAASGQSVEEQAVSSVWLEELVQCLSADERIILHKLYFEDKSGTDCQHGAWNFQNSSASAQSQAASKIENFFGKHGKSIDQNHSPNGEISEGVYLPHAA